MKIKKKYRLTRWSVLCCSKDQGGLGILNLDAQNKCLLSKWLFKLINEQGVWQTLLRRKYLQFKSLTQVEYSPGDSHFWSGLMHVKPEFLRWGKFKLGNGSLIRFWEDTWLGNEPLKNQYPALYNIVRKKSALVSSVLSSIPLNVSFRRSLVANNLLSWHLLVARVMDIQLQD